MKKIADKYIKEFITAAHNVAAQGLVVGGSGNMSWRVNDGLMLITTTASSMAGLSEKDVAVCRIEDGVTLNMKKPSKEIGFHAGILRKRADVNAVLHFQSPWATTIACRNPQIKNFYVIPEIPYYIGPVSVVPYLIPGSKQLADAVTSALMKHEMAILRNHGQVVVGLNLDQVIANAVYFEMACHVILGTGGKVQYMSKSDIADLRREGQAYRTKCRMAMQRE
ncbi:MAG: class II aldolase/adducin family protein [Kiritimatiellae bacterium]|nr:class II aldolase/adducin family protein [Kiritimatiellia bacterium]MDD5521170.1 class II aldolase/adducin family protein [Kiritimatiellia bacterium]